MSSPRMQLLEPRRLLAFVAGGASTINGDGFQSVDKITSLNGGGYIAAGLFSGTTTFSPGVSIASRDDTDAFLQLVRGNHRSTLAIGADTGNRLKFKDDRVDFITQPRRATDDSPFGVNAIARRADEYVSQLKIGPDGKLYVAVVFRDSISLNTQNAKGRVLTARDDFHGEYYDSAILRFSIATGRFALEDVKHIGGPFNDVIDDFTFDQTGNLLVSGSFERRCDFDPSAKRAEFDPLGRGDSFVAKYGRSGRLQWVAQLGGNASNSAEIEAGYSLVAGPDDSVYVGGTLASDAQFAVDGHVQRDVARAVDLTDGYTMRLTSAGALDWIRVQGGKDYDGVRALANAPDGGVYNVGYFQNDADLDASATREEVHHANDQDSNKSNDRTDLFFTRFDNAGNTTIVKQLSGTGTELIASAATTASGQLVIAGSYFGTLDADPSGRTRLITAPDSDNKDLNDRNRDQAYAGFVAVYSPGGRLDDLAQVVGASNQDVFITGAARSADGSLAIAGRYRGGFNVVGTSTRVGTNTTFDNYREDGFSLVFDAGLTPIT